MTSASIPGWSAVLGPVRPYHVVLSETSQVRYDLFLKNDLYLGIVGSDHALAAVLLITLAALDAVTAGIHNTPKAHAISGLSRKPSFCAE